MSKHFHPGLCFPGSEVCRLEETSERHRDYWQSRRDGQSRVTLTRVEFKEESCCWQGKKVLPPLAPDKLRDWHQCEHPEKPRGEIVCPCHGCNSSCRGYEEEPGIIPVNHGAGGLGDQLLGLCAVKGLREETGKPISYAVSPLGRPFVELFDGWDYLRHHVHDQNREEPPSGVRLQVNVGYTYECKTSAKRTRIGRYLDNLGVRVAKLPQLLDLSRVAELGRDFRNCVAVSPFSSSPKRDWRIESWLTLVRLLQESGHRVVLVHSTAERTAAFKCEKLIGVSAERLTGALLHCSAVVANDSGIAHLGGILGRPTIVVCGHTSGKDIYGFYPRVACLQGKLDCDACWWQEPFSGLVCDTTCASMQSITPENVVEQVAIQTAAAATRGLDCIGPAKCSIVLASLRSVNHLVGDVAEFGVWRGGVALAMSECMQGGTLHLFDTFEGLPHDDAAVGGLHRRGDFGDTQLMEVKKLLPSAVFHVGKFPETAVDNLRFRFVHLDFDLYESTLAAIDYLTPRMANGGVIVFDDYAWPHCPGVQRAIHERFGFHVPLGRPSQNQAVLRFPIGK